MGAINKKYTTEEFIKKAIQVHGNLYDYSNVVYVSAHEKVCIVCNKCGNRFFQTPANHLSGKGCKSCAMEYVVSKRRLTKEEFIRRANEIHGEGTYCYDNVVYVNANKKVDILCPEHGHFKQTPANHLKGHGCPSCSGKERWSKSRFVHLASLKFGNKFDYSNSEITTGDSNVEIKCNTCGTIFYQSPKNHLCSIQGGCPTCRYGYVAQSEKISFEEFKKRSIAAHGDKYSYYEETYKNISSEVMIHCPEHGDFSQIAISHTLGCGCPVCADNELSKKLTHTNEWFLEKAREIHGDRYIYSLCDYKGLDKHVTIICPKHGKFKQRAADHIKGYGCPVCRSTIGEERINRFLFDNNIRYIREFRIETEKSRNNREGVFVDFYLPDFNIIIEFNGEQHYRPVERCGGEKSFRKQKERDEWLRSYCKNNNIKLVEIPYSNINNIKEILKVELKNK